MKKIVMMIIVLFLFTIPSIFAQAGKQPVSEPIKPQVGISLPEEGKKISVTSSILNGADTLIISWKQVWTINDKSVVFSSLGVKSDGVALSNDEIQMIEKGVEIIECVFKNCKAETPELDFMLKTGERTILIDISSRHGKGAVLRGTFSEWMINGKPIEFKSDDNGSVVVNNGALSVNEIASIEQGFKILKQFFLMITGTSGNS